jgi:hypothetical protein
MSSAADRVVADIVGEIEHKNGAKIAAVQEYAQRVRELDEIGGSDTQMRAARAGLAKAVRALAKSANAGAMKIAADVSAANPHVDLDKLADCGTETMKEASAALTHAATELDHIGAANAPNDLSTVVDALIHPAAPAAPAQSGGALTPEERTRIREDETVRFGARRHSQMQRDFPVLVIHLTSAILNMRALVIKTVYTDHGIDPYKCDVEAVVSASKVKLVELEVLLEKAETKLRELPLAINNTAGVQRTNRALLQTIAELKSEIARLKYVVKNLPGFRFAYIWNILGGTAFAAVIAVIGRALYLK